LKCKKANVDFMTAASDVGCFYKATGAQGRLL